MDRQEDSVKQYSSSESGFKGLYALQAEEVEEAICYEDNQMNDRWSCQSDFSEKETSFFSKSSKASFFH